MALIILRCIFLICAGSVSALINSRLAPQAVSASTPYLIFVGIMLAAVSVVVTDIYVRRKRIDTIS